jgi:hypothetical protein
MSTSHRSTMSRRTVFAGAGTLGALAAAAAIVPAAKPEPVQPVADAGKAATDDGRYQLTEHVRRYYRTARV